MASAREKLTTNGSGVPSLFAYTIKDTQKLGEHRFPSKNKYIKNDITISKGIESRDTDLEGFGDVIKKVKKEDVQVPAGAIRKHKMVKQISGRFNSEGKKKGFDIFALIDDAIDKEPTEEAKEKARERAAAKNAVNEPIPPRVFKKKEKPKPGEPTPPTFQTHSTEGEMTTKAINEPVGDRHAEVSDAPIHNVPAMFATSTNNSIPKREPAWKLRLQDKKPKAPTTTPVPTNQASLSEDQVEKATGAQPFVKEMGATTTNTPAQVVAPPQASLPVAVFEDTVSSKKEDFECIEEEIALSSEKNHSGENSLDSSPHVTGAPDEQKANLKVVLSPVAVALTEDTPKDSLEVNPPPVAVSVDRDLSKGVDRDFKNEPVADAVTSEFKSLQKEPAWKLRLQERQAPSSGELDGTKGTSIDSVHNARTLAANVESPAVKKEPAWKLRLQERQGASSIAEPVAPVNNDVSETGVVLEDVKVDAPNNKLNDPPEEAPEDDDFSVSISSVESDQSHKEHISDSGGSHGESPPEQVVVAASPMEPERSSLQDVESDLEISAPLSEKSGGQLPDSYDEPKSYSVQHIECAVENSAPSLARRNSGVQAIEAAASLEAEPIRRPLTHQKYSNDSDSDDSTRNNGVQEKGTAASLKVEPISRPLTFAKYGDDSDSDVSDSSSDDDLPRPRTLKRASDIAPEVTKFVQSSKFALGSTASGISLTEKVDALLARNSPSVLQSLTATVPGTPSDKLEWLREQIKETEKKIQATIVDVKLQVSQLRKLFDDEKEIMQEDFEERTGVQRRLNLEQDKKHEKLLNEERKIVESLRTENKTLRGNADRLPKQMAEMKQSIANLEAANEEIETHTEDLLRFSKKLEADHDKLIESRNLCRDVYLPRYRKELWERQMALDTETRIKTLYRDCVIKIAKHVAESSRKPDFVEEINAIVLDTEAEVNPKFDPRVLVGSDSDSSSSSDSDDSSDSDSSSD